MAVVIVAFHDAVKLKRGHAGHEGCIIGIDVTDGG